MKYALLINLSILVLVTAGAGVLVYTLQPSTVPTAVPLQDSGRLGPVHVRAEETETLSIDMRYPTISESFPGAPSINGDIERELDKLVSQFKQEASSTSTDLVDLPSTVKSYVQGGYTVEYENERLISLLFKAEWYMRGAAHPYHTVHTYIFDKKLGRLVTLQDMFMPSSGYLAYLSTYAYNDLLRQSKEGDKGFTHDEETVKEGTEAALENFKHVLPVRNGLMFYFDEYQVAPYAAGPQQVVVPYEKLKQYVEPSGILGWLVK